jgi:two-component system CheB/CheR fusion protein
MMPYRTVDNVISGVVLTFVDITKMSAAEARISELTSDLSDRIASLETLLDVLPVGILILQDGQRMGDIRVNRYGAQLLGDGVHGADGGALRLTTRSLRLFQGDRELPAEEQPLQVAARSGGPVANFEGQLLRSDGERRDLMITSTPLLDEAGKSRGAIAAIVDISERKHAEARQQVLLYELQHRVKNIIATISALASRTLRTDSSAQQFADAFLGRLRGMAATHDLLSRANWSGAPLGELINSALRTLGSVDGSNVGVKGPEVMMAPNAAATLGMAFYELATNATKYGALSTPSGRVEVTWRTEESNPGGRVVVTWRESGGKPPDKNAPPGFGMSFVKRSVEYELHGTAAMEHTGDGLRWMIEFPFQQNLRHS